MRDDLVSLHAYNRWADTRVLEAAGSLSPDAFVKEPVSGWISVRDALVHIAGATWIWSRRLEGETPTARPGAADYPTVESLSPFFEQGHSAFETMLSMIDSTKLAEVWSYRDIEGVLHQAPLWSVFRHVVNHATYHRGQIASKLKMLGVTPPGTDFILWARDVTRAGG